MKSLLFPLVLGLITSLSATLTWADENDRYIIDTIYVSLRSGPGNEYRVVKSSMPSGTKMSAMGQSEDNLWTQVTLSTGEPLEGWIPTRYISGKLIAKDQLAAATETIASLKDQLANGTPAPVVDEATVPTADNDAVIAERDALLEELNNIKMLSTDVIAVDQTNSELLLENQELKTELDILRIENQYLSESNRTRDWMIGGVIAFFGLIIGLVLARMGKPTRRSDSWA
jgi:SH3 domain protein